MEAKAAAKAAAREAQPQPRAPVPTKEPSAHPYRDRKLDSVIKEEQVVRTVSEHDGQNLLRKIDAKKGGRDIIVLMRDSRQTPKELAEDLILNETIVITSLNAHGGGKDRIERLLVAIKQAPAYLDNDDVRPVTTGARQQIRWDKAKAKREKIASKKRKPRTTRVVVVPTLAEVAPRREDQQIVFEALKQYLDRNANLRTKVMGAHSDARAKEILISGTGPGFDANVKALLAAPSEYQDFLAKAGATIRREARKYDTSDTPPTGPTPSINELPEALAREQFQKSVFASYDERLNAAKSEVQSDVDDPEEKERLARFDHQEEVMKEVRKRYQPLQPTQVPEQDS